jgi:hypothetical protein
VDHDSFFHLEKKIGGQRCMPENLFAPGVFQFHCTGCDWPDLFHKSFQRIIIGFLYYDSVVPLLLQNCPFSHIKTPVSKQ